MGTPLPDQIPPAADPPATITRLLSHMTAQGDFPAVGLFLAEVTSALQRPTASSQQIANLILKDFALTNALLRTVNSAFFASARGQQVSTVSRAVLLLGVDTVGNLAVGLRLLEHFNGPGELRTVRTLMLESLLTGVHAREIAQCIRNVVPEEAFIAGLTHDLGRLSVAYYLPDAYAKISHRAARLGVSLTEAAPTVLETSFETIGQAIAQAWNFPDKICNATDATTGGVLHHIVSFARELTTLLAATASDERSLRLIALRERFEPHLPVRAAELERLVTASSLRLQELLRILHVSPRALAEDLRPPTPPTDTTAPLVLLAIDEITEALAGPFALNDVLMLVLEGMYRGLGFAHAVLLLVTHQRDVLRGRCMLGAGAEHLLAEMQVPLVSSGSDISAVITEQHELVTSGPFTALGFSPAVIAALAPSVAAALPIVVNGIAIGALYVDRGTTQPEISPEELRGLRLLRDQAILAVRHSRPA